MYCAIIGDMVNSRNIENRSEIQKKMKEILDNVNVRFSSSLASKFTITLGDEFQGLLTSVTDLITIIDYMKFEFYPIKLRFGIGFGEMFTEVFEDIAIGSDGPAYYAAREAVDSIKKSRSRYEQPDQDIKFECINNSIKHEFKLLNTSLSMCSYIERRWTDKQRAVIKLMLFGEKTQREIAYAMEVSQSSIQRRLVSGGYFTYKNAKDDINDYVKKIWEEIHV